MDQVLCPTRPQAGAPRVPRRRSAPLPPGPRRDVRADGPGRTDTVGTGTGTGGEPRDTAGTQARALRRQEAADELCGSLFASMPRRDQRQKGEQYLRGLLLAEGRKSIRNIAGSFGQSALEQSLQHFISNSPWDWMPVRAALASYAARLGAPHAHVVRQLSIPKTGEQSVGVDRSYDPELGQMVRGQQAFGVWQASEAVSTPVNWRLFLPESWIEDLPRRHRAEIPAEFTAETLEQCAVSAALEAAALAGGPGGRVRPVVLDLPLQRPGPALHRLAAAGVPALVRVREESRFTVEDPALPGFGAGPRSAGRILASVRGLRRPAGWLDPQRPGGRRMALVTTVKVALPGAAAATAGRPGDGLLLFGEWSDPRGEPDRIWVAGTRAAHPEALLRTTKLTARVDRDLARVGEGAGLRDFEGRSFCGWHRHITLASAAHAITMAADGRL
ncbi:transposase [Streptomyces sp. NPDC089919]|uniref:IS701 family transposase n=1 Tax=Streptomyces sp. NPDC089919 TaxID=3155188 RepID=UPI00341341BD